MSNAATIPAEIAEAIVSPRAHAERDVLFSGLRWLRASNTVGLVEAEGYDPFWLLTRHQDVLEVSRAQGPSLSVDPRLFRSASP
jgi:hypothetical protein